ncbi:hypothetical protein EIN_168290 [Entamoeba invadens IP1]|uniref:Ras-GEF domain-containing protein n=1 Tax=Entamoeba invadens IP1 TaxID=370355 RepID=A0A0A1TVJ7_ENTIV|nr:hypothetical protein EIN_168290 [Entamoeba invadens IP1]ELP84464.1 hypothetical protein EIN_168290 [Entamoeba invadens IP1]|eukprot:XP_004183810.1 hypothetical protein EIN_168290 [Entamoeba invadens IP1]
MKTQGITIFPTCTDLPIENIDLAKWALFNIQDVKRKNLEMLLKWIELVHLPITAVGPIFSPDNFDDAKQNYVKLLIKNSDKVFKCKGDIFPHFDELDNGFVALSPQDAFDGLLYPVCTKSIFEGILITLKYFYTSEAFTELVIKKKSLIEKEKNHGDLLLLSNAATLWSNLFEKETSKETIERLRGVFKVIEKPVFAIHILPADTQKNEPDNILRSAPEKRSESLKMAPKSPQTSPKEVSKRKSLVRLKSFSDINGAIMNFLRLDSPREHKEKKRRSTVVGDDLVDITIDEKKSKSVGSTKVSQNEFKMSELEKECESIHIEDISTLKVEYNKKDKKLFTLNTKEFAQQIYAFDFYLLRKMTISDFLHTTMNTQTYLQQIGKLEELADSFLQNKEGSQVAFEFFVETATHLLNFGDYNAAFLIYSALAYSFDEFADDWENMNKAFMKNYVVLDSLFFDSKTSTYPSHFKNERSIYTKIPVMSILLGAISNVYETSKEDKKAEVLFVEKFKIVQKSIVPICSVYNTNQVIPLNRGIQKFLFIVANSK